MDFKNERPGFFEDYASCMQQWQVTAEHLLGHTNRERSIHDMGKTALK